MVDNISMKKYLMLTEKYGHDYAITRMTKFELLSIYKLYMDSEPNKPVRSMNVWRMPLRRVCCLIYTV